ncbi:MAG: hypothetical protein IPJ65_04065 [Archangiaceae bacterium]|nr:hypothetical protein [Archangiaceae bacterium]
MRTTISQSESIEKASGPLLEFALNPRNWLTSDKRRVTSDYYRRVEALQICASVDVTPTLDTWLHVSFRGPNLTPMQGADLLESFVRGRFTFIPNMEWVVEIDSKGWIHFTRRYTGPILRA